MAHRIAGKPGRNPHPPDVVGHVLDLHQKGYSSRTIARLLNIGKTAAAEIVAGTHCAQPRDNSQLRPDELRVTGRVCCPECGTPLAVQPCRVCRVRSLEALLQASNSRICDGPMPTPAEANDILSLKLNDAQAERLAEIRSGTFRAKG